MYDLEHFAKRFLTGRINWWDVPRQNAIINFGNIISLCLYRHPPFQVELFIVPHAPSSFTEHRHPDVDVLQFGLSGDAMLLLNRQESYSKSQVQQWLRNELVTPAIRIKPTDMHSGYGNTRYAFLSIQHWLNNVQPTSVGLNWVGEPSSVEQWAMLSAQSGHQMLA